MLPTDTGAESAFDRFLEAAWNDHADAPAIVAMRLAETLDIVTDSAHVASYARIVTHVYGEHLARYDEGIELLERLRASAAAQEVAGAQAATARSIAVLRHCRGDVEALASLSSEDRITVLATAASAFAEQKQFGAAIDAYTQSLALAQEGLADGSPALRALAVGGNNLAAALEEKTDRDAQETRGMLVAAQGGLDYWRRAGTWLEEARAEFRLSASRRCAGDYDAATNHAQRCIDLCRAHDAPPIEHFFATAALAFAQRSAGLVDDFEASRHQARQWHDQVADDERQWCASTLVSLDAPA